MRVISINMRKALFLLISHKSRECKDCVIYELILRTYDFDVFNSRVVSKEKYIVNIKGGNLFGKQLLMRHPRNIYCTHAKCQKRKDKRKDFGTRIKISSLPFFL